MSRNSVNAWRDDCPFINKIKHFAITFLVFSSLRLY